MIATRKSSEAGAPTSDPGLETDEPAVNFPVVAIGASAGGLEALTDFFHALRPDTDMAYVVVTHLDRTHESQMPQMVGRMTTMPVHEATEAIPVQLNHVYVIPPNSHLTFSQGALHLEPREAGAGHMYVIDRFFRSLAKAQGRQCVGVILSGSLSDGALGLAEIRAAGGLTFAQAPETARYPDMPTSAIATGNVDFVLSPTQMAAELPNVRERLNRTEELTGASTSSKEEEAHLEELFRILHTRVGMDFRNYKRATLMRRILRRMTAHRVETLSAYVGVLRQQKDEARILAEEILIHVTSFFRESQSFRVLRERILPTLLQGRPANKPLRIWVPGCATGEEAYSFAIAVAEFLVEAGSSTSAQIFATDASEKTIRSAREGFYPESIAQDVSPERLSRFFERSGGGYRVNKAIRGMCVFAVHNLVMDPPFSNMDVVSCCNVLIYMDSSLQQRVLARFHYALRPDGYLLLGAAETVARSQEFFEPLEKQARIYAKRDVVPPVMLQFDATQRIRAGTHAAAPAPAGWSEAELRKEVDKLLLAQHAPSGVVINGDFEILEFRGDPRPFLVHPDGVASLNVLKMAQEGLAVELRSAVQEAKAKGERVQRSNIRIRSGNGRERMDLDVVPIRGAGLKDVFFLVKFVPEAQRARQSARQQPSLARRGGWIFGRKQARELEGRIGEMTAEVEAARGHLQFVNDDHAGAIEELRALNEEAASSNEELQSTNEEFESTREELQSTNEELRTINDELQQRNQDVQKVSDDLLNLLNSVDIAIVMLAPDMRIRRFTPTAKQMLKLTPADIGRSFMDIKASSDAPNLKDQVLEVLQTAQARKSKARSKKGAAAAELEIHPYRTADGRIDGVVLVFKATADRDGPA